MATANGTVKKTALADFSRPRASGIIAIDLRENDYLIDVAITDGSQDIMLFSDAGKVIRFSEGDVRAMGRTACGVRGIKLRQDQHVISLIIASDSPVLTATENGYGKRTLAEDYPVHGRGGQGVIAIQVTERNGEVVGAVRGRRKRRGHADQRRRHPGAYPRQRDFRHGQEHPGCASD